MNDKIPDWVRVVMLLLVVGFLFGLPIFCIVVGVIVEAINKLRKP